MKAMAARLGTSDWQVLEAILDDFLPEIRKKDIKRDPRTLEDLDSAAVLPETARSNPAFKSDSSTTWTACWKFKVRTSNIKFKLCLIKRHNHSIKAIQSQEGLSFLQDNLKKYHFLLYIPNFLRKNQDFLCPNSFNPCKPHSNYKCYSCNKPVILDVDPGMLSVISVDKKVAFQQYVLHV